MKNLYPILRGLGVAAAMTMTASLYAQTGTLTIEVKDISATDATVIVTPSSDDLSYYWGLYTKEMFENIGGADKVVENRINIWKNSAGYYGDGTTWQEMMSFDVKTGVTNESITERFDYYPDTDYVLYAFGMDAEGNVNAPLVVKEFTNAAPPAPSYTLTLDVKDIKSNDATVIVTPSDDSVPYYWGLSAKTVFENNGGAEKAIENRIAIWKNTASYYDDGTTWQEMMSYDVKTGATEEPVSERFEKLSADTDYVVYAFGMDAEGNVIAPLVVKDFKTSGAIASDNTFTVKLVSVQPDQTQRMTVIFQVTPSNSDSYTACLVDNQYIKNVDFTPGSESEKQFISNYLIYNLRESNTYTGEQTLTYNGQTADADYSFFVIGVDENGNPSTALTKYDFRTERYPSRSIALEVTDITPMNAHIKVTPSDPEMRYYIDIAPTELVAEKGGVDCIPEKFIIDWWKFIASLYDDAEWTDLVEIQTITGNLDTTVAALVEEGRLSTQYWDSNWTLYAVGFSTSGEILTPTAIYEYTSPAPKKSDLTFTFEPYAVEKDETSSSSLENYSATIDIIPSRDGEQFMVNKTRKSTYDSWIDNPEYGLDEFIKSQWLPDAVPFTDAVRLVLPGLERYEFGGNERYYTLMVMGWDEGPATEPAIYEFSYDDLIAGVEITPERGTVVMGGKDKISVFGNCDGVVVYSASGQVVGALRGAGSIDVPAGVYVVSYTLDGKTKTSKVLVK